MSPKPFIENSDHDYSTNCDCAACFETERRRQYAHYAAEDPLSPARGIIFGLILSLACIALALLGAAVIWTHVAQARTGATPKPIAAPQSLSKARAACPIGKPLKCRAALVHALEAVEWQRGENLKLAREMVGKLTDWTCIHSKEGAWNAATGNGYHGGLQMDWSFMRTYGRDMLHRHAGRGAEAWTPREQIIVAQRAYAQGRGYAPWPNTSRMCGLR